MPWPHTLVIAFAIFDITFIPCMYLFYFIFAGVGPSSPAMLSKGAKKKLAEKRKGGGGESSSSGPLIKRSKAAPKPSAAPPTGAAPRQLIESPAGAASSPPVSTPASPLPLPALAPSSFGPSTSLVPSSTRPTPPARPSGGGSTLSIVPEVVPVIKAFQNHLPQSAMQDLREMTVPGSLDSVYASLARVSFLSLYIFFI